MTTRVHQLLAVSAISAIAGCTATSEPELLVPDVVSVAWSDAYDAEGDGLGAIVPLDVMVYESSSGAPLANIVLTIASEHDGTWVLPDGATMRSFDTTDADDANEAFSADGLEGDGADRFDTIDAFPPAAIAGQVLWDARHDRYVVVDADASELAVGSGNFTTDANGVARIRLFVDRFPAGDVGGRGGAFSDVAVVISAASPEEPLEGVVLLQPR
jgi:hypothetical protein